VQLDGLKFDSSGGYTIVAEIGRGGMGIVYVAERECEGVADVVALKMLRSQGAETESKFKAEANLATNLRHENIVKTYGLEAIAYDDLPQEFSRELEGLSHETGRRVLVDRLRVTGPLTAKLRTRLRVRSGADQKKLYLIVMDYVEGTDLRTLHQVHVDRRLLIPCPIAGFIVSRVARALAYAHQFIIHRDISPENVLINTQGVVKLSDFGVAAGDTSAAGTLTGKLPYMSPEQARRQPVDARTDLYSLGLVLYQILTGIHPQRIPKGLTREQQMAHLEKLLSREIPPAVDVRTDVPKALSDMCAKMLARNRDARYARALDCVSDLEKRYLYARGFGPTNNSLQAYWEAFQNDFEATPDQLAELTFLRDDSKKVVLRRPVTAEFYTPLGREMIEGR
jgi:serine/threonine protein kinase